MIDSQYKVWTDECKDTTDDGLKWEYIKCKINMFLLGMYKRK